MTVYICDNSVDGILCALFSSFIDKIKPDQIIDRKFFQPRFDAYVKEILTDKNNADRVKKALFNYGGDDIIAHLKVCLSSCDERAMTVAFNYGYLTLKERRNVSEKLSDKAVSDFSYLVQKVLHERHIVSGFLRFRESKNGVLYAQYSPDNDITSILAPHFLRRLGNNPFIIHDMKRNKIAISNGRAIKFDYTELPPSFTPSDNESNLNLLWKRYFNHINIKERKNTSQQDGYFPRRYRKYCFETWEE